MRSSLVGTIIGIIPGEGAAVAAYYAYAEEKRRSDKPEEFVESADQGLAPETANNATVGGALLPTMTTGVPGTPAAAILLGAFAINNLTPGPRLLKSAANYMRHIYWSVPN